MHNSIIVKGAKEHNLKNVSLKIPKNKIVVFTGVSGSGKSSLVFNTICAEAQRQLVETFSAHARQRLPKISKPHVDEIENISPAIVIDQKRLGTNLRSTVGTVTELYNYLRMLFSRCGEPRIGGSNLFSFNLPEGMCPHCGGLGKEMAIELGKVLDKEKSVEQGALLHSDFKPGGWYWRTHVKCGFYNPFVPVKEFSEQELHALLYHEPTTFSHDYKGEQLQSNYEGAVYRLKRRYMDKESDSSSRSDFFSLQDCSLCKGTRLTQEALNVEINGKNIGELVFLEMPDLLSFLNQVTDPVAEPLLKKMKEVIQGLIDIGVGYLNLHRQVATLSGGESQRVKMTRQLHCNLTGMLYILDEPTIGLHPRDVGKLIDMIRQLRDKGNTVLLVEHDSEVMKIADHIVDIGPEAGMNGGEVLFQGSYNQLLNADTLTAQCLKSENELTTKAKPFTEVFTVRNARANNLKNINVDIPKKVMVAVCGVAGSGKSTLIHKEFYEAHPEAICIDQSPVGRSNRSTPLSYLGIFDAIRKLFAQETGASVGQFSFNSKGACPECKGLGYIKVEMSFLDDVTMECPECKGKRFKEEVLQLKYKGKNIYDVLELTVNQALNFFEDKAIVRKLSLVQKVGLGYLKTGQALSTLSGGEAQRIKLATELHKKGNVYILDEPTTGLHMADTKRLMTIMKELVDKGNSVIVIEHNLDVIALSDYIIDMGPDGGKNGGYVLATGTPQELVNHPESVTGKFLRQYVAEEVS